MAVTDNSAGCPSLDGRPAAAVAELPCDVDDLRHYKPLREPATLYRGFRRRLVAESPAVEQPVVSSVAAQAEAWQEQLRRSLANGGRPPAVEKRLVCRNGHTLLWLLRSPWGHVPVARTADGRFTLRGSGRPDGSPMTLDQWPAGEHLPLASCACHDDVTVSVHQAKSWFERVGGSRRDKFVHSP